MTLDPLLKSSVRCDERKPPTAVVLYPGHARDKPVTIGCPPNSWSGLLGRQIAPPPWGQRIQGCGLPRAKLRLQLQSALSPQRINALSSAANLTNALDLDLSDTTNTTRSWVRIPPPRRNYCSLAAISVSGTDLDEQDADHDEPDPTEHPAGQRLAEQEP